MSIRLESSDQTLNSNPKVREYLDLAASLIGEEIKQRLENVLIYGTSHPEIDRQTSGGGDE